MTGIKEMQSAMQVMDVLIACRSFALPLNIRRIGVFLILPEAIIMFKRDQRRRLFLFVHQGPVK